MEVEWDVCKQQSTSYFCVLERSLRYPRTPGRSQGRCCHRGTVAAGQGGGWNCFLASAGGRQRVQNKRYLSTAFQLLPIQLTESLPPYRLLLSGHRQSVSLFSPPDPYTKQLPGGCCSRNKVQAFDSVPDHWQKGCHFSFRALSIPRQLFISKNGRHTSYYIHTSLTMSPTHSCPLTSYCTENTNTFPQT